MVDTTGQGSFKHEGNSYIYLSYQTGEVINMPAGLSRAEAAVLELVARGLTNQEIAEQRGVSKRTVDCQVASIFRRVGVSSRAELLVEVFSAK